MAQRITDEEKEKIRELKNKGLNNGKISKKLNLNNNTVSMYVSAFNKGFNSLIDYQNYLAKNREYNSYQDYKESWAKKKGFSSRAEYQEVLVYFCGLKSAVCLDFWMLKMHSSSALKPRFSAGCILT